MIRKRYIILLAAALMSVQGACAQNAFAEVPRHVVAFYNVEDLFDTEDDPSAADEDMLPLADRGWTEERYEAKLQSLARVVAQMGEEYGFPALIGMAEVENRAVIEDLAAQEAIAAAGYEVCYADSRDSRGIDVGFLYRPDVLHVDTFHTVEADCGYPLTRDFAVIDGRIDGERIYVVAVHLPSRRGGEWSERQRRACVSQVRRMVDSVRAADAAVKVVVMGDMNDEPHNRSIKRDLGARGRVDGDTHLYNPFALRRRAGRGSYSYDGRWNMLDQIIVSPNLVSGDVGGLRLCRIDGRAMGRVFRREWMLRDGEPYATYRGSDYEGGVSDHLPVYVILGREEKAARN